MFPVNHWSTLGSFKYELPRNEATTGSQSPPLIQRACSKLCCTENNHTPKIGAKIEIGSCTSNTSRRPSVRPSVPKIPNKAALVSHTDHRSVFQHLGVSNGIR